MTRSLDMLLRNVDVVTPNGVRRADVGITDGQIVEIADAIRANALQDINASGLHLFPGVIDSHVHFNEPGRTDWEGATTGSSALAAGGGTCFFDMPLNSTPPVLDAESFDRKLEACLASSVTDFALWGGLTPGNLDHMEDLADRGVIGFKAFMSDSGIDDYARADDLTLLRGMEQAARLGLPVAVHAESEELTSNLTRAARGARRTGVLDYLATRPIVTEVDAIRRAILFAQETGCSLHVVHASSAAGCAEVVESRYLWRKDRAGPVHATVETCPHYLALSEQDAVTLGAVAKCAPPLRSAAEVEALWRQLLSGGINFVASDHSPAPASMKTSTDFFSYRGRIAGLQSTLAVLLSRVPHLPLELVARLTSSNVAARYSIPGKGTLAPGFDADFSIVDLGASYELTRDMLMDRHKLSPYVGRTFRGRIKQTYVRGVCVFDNGQIVSKPIGRLVKPGAIFHA